jgi:hypothetical protein
MKGFIAGLAVSALVWAAGWDTVASVLDAADAAAKQAYAATQRALGDARARRATQPRRSHESESTGR